MNRPTDREAALEAELAALVPAAPSAGVRQRVAGALAVRGAAPPRGRWLAERLLWACGGAAAGALAAAVAVAPTVGPAVAPPATDTRLRDVAPVAPATLAAAGPAVEVAEESVAWADAGVQFLDDRTPARILRRVAVERHQPAGGSEYRVPREDVILLPVALH